MDLEELRGLLAVVETGSMLGAATRLGVPRGTLRRRIDTLEARAGVPLLERTAKGMTATEAGTLLAERGRTLLHQGAALLSAVRKLGNEPSGLLRVQLPVGLPPSGVSSFMQMLRMLMPKMRVRMVVREELPSDSINDVDLLMHFDDHSPTGAWSSHTLLRVPVRLLASPTYLERAGVPRSAAELSAHTLATWVGPDDEGTHWPLRAGGSVEVSPVMVSNDVHLLRVHVRAGSLMALVPDADIDLLGLPLDNLVPVLEDVVGRTIALKLSVTEAAMEDPMISRVVGMVRDLMARTRGVDAQAASVATTSGGH